MAKVACAFVILKLEILVFIGAHGGRFMCFCNFEICNFGINPVRAGVDRLVDLTGLKRLFGMTGQDK